MKFIFVAIVQITLYVFFYLPSIVAFLTFVWVASVGSTGKYDVNVYDEWMVTSLMKTSYNIGVTVVEYANHKGIK